MNSTLKALRIERNVKQITIAKILNMTVSAYSRKENGQRSFSIDEAAKLAKFFDISIEKLFLK